jgi:hypothetical protein
LNKKLIGILTAGAMALSLLALPVTHADASTVTNKVVAPAKSVVSKTSTTAKVQDTQVTKKVKDPSFQNNQVVANHYLKLDKGKWKFVKSEVLSAKCI